MVAAPALETGSIAEVRRAVRGWKRAGEAVAFVPTMGYLHEGHASLVRIARERARRVVVSIFVNPMQFAPGEDLSRYPRDLDRDRGVLASVPGGVDLLFLPEARNVYPVPFFSAVEVSGVSEGLDGASRPGHFRGVATVVAKLFHMVEPDVAVFGRKDAQQLAVIRTMVRDLDFPIEIVPGETVREPDGLAMSSRNSYLSKDERTTALALSRALFAVRDRAAAGERNARLLRDDLAAALSDTDGVRLDYAEIVDGLTMRPKDSVEPETLARAAVFVGKTRLIDNVRIG
jgi:pantoate--beta-alanine ligase